MVILGIDPGLAIVGWGVIEYNGSKITTLGYGSIDTPAHSHRRQTFAHIQGTLTAYRHLPPRRDGG